MLFQKLAIKYSLKRREFLTNGGAPIDAYEPEWFMADSHISQEDNVKACLELQVKEFVPMHYGANRLADEKGPEVLERLYRKGKRDNCERNSYRFITRRNLYEYGKRAVIFVLPFLRLQVGQFLLLHVVGNGYYLELHLDNLAVLQHLAIKRIPLFSLVRVVDIIPCFLP